MSQILRQLRRSWSTGQQDYSNPFASCPNTSKNFCVFVQSEQMAPVVVPPSGAFGQICIGESWKSVSEVYVCISGAWKPVTEVNVCISGAWKAVTS